MLADIPTWPAIEISLAVGEIGTTLMCEYEGARVGKPSGLKFRVADDIVGYCASLRRVDSGYDGELFCTLLVGC